MTIEPANVWMFRMTCRVSGILLLAMIASQFASTQTVSIPYVFTGYGDGGNPVAGLYLDNEGNLYGTTQNGGAFNAGVVFELVPTSDGSWNETTLYSFGGVAGDGSMPGQPLIRDAAGNFYSTTLGGGSGFGTAFELSLSNTGWIEKTLYTFTAGSDGAYPSTLTADQAGNLYGTTSWGGAANCFSDSACGTVFELTPAADGGWTETTIYTFTNHGDGGYPLSGLVLGSTGGLYGTTSAGGNFNCSADPGVGCGTVFVLDPLSRRLKVLHKFNGVDGSFPAAPLITDVAGNLYGTTSRGGKRGSHGYCGVVFRFDISSRRMKVLYTFGVGSVHDGCQPTGPLVRDTEGNLFGTTAAGGEENQGTVFKIDASGHETVLLSFIHSKTGGTPSGGLVRDSAGNLYGTTFWGGGTDICGGGGCGTVFKIAP